MFIYQECVFREDVVNRLPHALPYYPRKRRLAAKKRVPHTFTPPSHAQADSRLSKLPSPSCHLPLSRLKKIKEEKA